MALAGVGGTGMMTGATMYLNDIATPRNRARTNAPLQVYTVHDTVHDTVHVLYSWDCWFHVNVYIYILFFCSTIY